MMHIRGTIDYMQKYIEYMGIWMIIGKALY